jgi:hypothetical protein
MDSDKLTSAQAKRKALFRDRDDLSVSDFAMNVFHHGFPRLCPTCLNGN